MGVRAVVDRFGLITSSLPILDPHHHLKISPNILLAFVEKYAVLLPLLLVAPRRVLRGRLAALEESCAHLLIFNSFAARERFPVGGV